MHDLGRWIGALGAAAVVALTCGCSSGSDPSTLPDVTPDTTTLPAESPSPTTEPSVDPAESLKAEVEKFVREYEALLDTSWHSATALQDRRSRFADDCDICLAGYEAVRDAHTEGLTFEGESSALHEVAVLDVTQERASVMVTVDVGAAQLTNANGEVVETFPPSPGLQIVYQLVRPHDQGWLILQSEVL